MNILTLKENKNNQIHEGIQVLSTKKMKRQKNTNWGKIRIENTKIGVIK